MTDHVYVAPRISEKDIEANIKHIEIVKFASAGGKIIRWAVITVQNGYAVTGKPSASVCADNDNAEIGERIAIENAKSELWGLMGYNLAEKMNASVR